MFGLRSVRQKISNSSSSRSRSSYRNQYLQEMNTTASELDIELVPEVSILNVAEHIVVEKTRPILCITPYCKRTTYVHGILLDNDPMSDMFLKVALYERKGRRKETCSIVDILKFTSNHNLYRVLYNERSNLKSADDVIDIATYIADNPSHLEYHRFSTSEDFALFCKIEWGREPREDLSTRVQGDQQGFFWDEDDDPILEADRSPLIGHYEL